MNTKISLIIALFAMGVMFFLGNTTVNAEEDYKGWDNIFSNDYMPLSDFEAFQREEKLKLKTQKVIPGKNLKGPYVTDKSIWGDQEYWPHQDRGEFTPETLMEQKKIRPVNPDSEAAFGDGGL